MQLFLAAESGLNIWLSKIAFIVLKPMLYKDLGLLEKLGDRTCE
jgi:hypothetical protein